MPNICKTERSEKVAEKRKKGKVEEKGGGPPKRRGKKCRRMGRRGSFGWEGLRKKENKHFIKVYCYRQDRS